MGKKETFINEIEKIIEDLTKTNGVSPLSEDARIYFEALKGGADNEKPAFTENGKKVLSFMIKNRDEFNNLFKAKDIGDRIELMSRSVSGACRKLVSDGYVEKLGEKPVTYSLTQKGISVIFEENEE